MSKKRYTTDNGSNEDVCLVDNVTGEEYESDFDEIVDLLNEQEERINELELENAKHIGDGEWDIRDITYGHGKFRLEEWGERYHQFYDGDKPLEDETVVSLLFENDKLKQQIETKNQQIKKLESENQRLEDTVDSLTGTMAHMEDLCDGDVE